MDVWLDDLEDWKSERVLRTKMEPEELSVLLELADKVENNTLRYVKILEEILDDMVEEERRMEAHKRSMGINGQVPPNMAMDTSNYGNDLSQKEYQVMLDAFQSSLHTGSSHPITTTSSSYHTGDHGANTDPKDDGKPKAKAVQALLKRR
jgi:hypothetical protein